MRIEPAKKRTRPTPRRRGGGLEPVWRGIGLSDRARGPAIIALCLIAVLAIAGGASRPDTLGQAVVRSAAAAAIVALVLMRAPLRLRALKVPAILLGCIAALALVQLVPLPPALWTRLPGRESFVEIAPLAGFMQVWRPVDLVPDGGINALSSLIVPLATLLVFAALDRNGRRMLLPVLLVWMGADAMFGLLQASGGAPDNAFVNGSPEEMAGAFANRNHQALFLAIGIFLIPCWAFAEGREWRNPRVWLALAGVALFAILILATGSRSGAVLGAVALIAGLAVGTSGRRTLAGTRRWKPVLIAAGAGLALALVVAGIGLVAGRALSFDRFAATSAEGEIRLRALPTSLQLVRDYFPVGSGLGSFDPVFRKAEPFSLLKPTFFNHAHNDYLEIAIETGIAGLTLIAAALVWLTMQTIAAWRSDDADAMTARMGSVILLLVLIASITDYPARTPAIMALVVIAACWLSRATAGPGGALPSGAKSV